MSLRQRTLIVYTMTIVALVLGGYIAARLIVLGSFRNLEENATRQNVERAVNALSVVIDQLNTTAGDWAFWDDAYAFVDDHNEAFIKANLGDESLNSLQINIMLFVDPSGRVVFGKAIDLDSLTEIPVPDALLQRLSSTDILVQQADVHASSSGIILLPDGLMAIVSRPILPSDREGPVRGALIIGRYLDAVQLERLVVTTALSLRMGRLDINISPSDFAAVRPALTSSEPIAVRNLSERTIAGYALLNDLDGQPVAILRVDMPRDIYRQGQTTTVYFGLALLAAGILFAAAQILYLDRGLLLRLAHLDRSVNSIGASGDRSARVAVSGSDELSELARAINRMLQAVEHSHGVAQEATTRYQQLFEEVQTGVLVVDALSHLIVDVNSAAVRMLGTTKDDIVGSPCQRFCPEESTPATTGKSGQQLTNTEGVLISANGERIPIMRAETSIKLAGQTRLLESIVDISAQKQHETWLTNLAYNDPLTGVSNRRTLEENLERAIDCAKSGIPSALMQIDLDRFKQVNDVMGHDAGDQVLILLTAIMKLHLRSSDILARMGGDEFAILMQQTKLECAREVAERVRRKVEEATIVVNDVGLRLTISVGVVAVDGELPVREQLVRADAAMYAAKRLGRNRTEVSRVPPPAPN